jgi:hypothetical protein
MIACGQGKTTPIPLLQPFVISDWCSVLRLLNGQPSDMRSVVNQQLHAFAPMPDHRARKILFNTYWSRGCWKRDPTVAPEDFAYARDAGYMFDPVELSHDDLIRWLHTSWKSVSRKHVTGAFLASLSTRRLELRSALGSYSVGTHFPEHTYQGTDFCCAICGTIGDSPKSYDLSMLNFERHKWGGVRHERAEYIAFDLEQMARLEPAAPSHYDLEIMRHILAAASECASGTRPRGLEGRLAGLLDSNKAERDILLQILAYCGILQPATLPTYRISFIEFSRRSEPPGNRFWTYPMSWWRGEHGVNEAAVKFYFPDL